VDVPTTRFILNGEQIASEHHEDATALSAIRCAGCISPKNGCSPQGHCGCCTVLINGKPVMSCIHNASKMEGKEITTLEGFSERRRAVLSRAFVQVAGLQCGFCIPGIMVRAAALLDKNPEADRGKIARVLTPHLCRCTGYVKILDAVEVARDHWLTDSVPEIPTETGIGASAARYRGVDHCLGDKPYVDDMRLPEMLYGAVRLSDHPRARVLSIDTSAAEAVAGVHKVITAQDIPGNPVVGLIYPDWPVMIAEGGVTHCVGSVIAAVAADSDEAAREACAAVVVEYEVLVPVTDPEVAMAEGAEEVHPGRPNLLKTSAYKRGDVDEALASAAHVLEETFHTQCIEHAFLEPECALALPEGDGIRVYTQGQGVHDDQIQLASLMGVELDQIQVELVSNGGAFGGKEDLSVQPHAVLLAHHTGRPVKVLLSRDESIRLHPKRHPLTMRYTIGADAEGRMTALRAHIIGDTGAYASVGDKVLERAAGHACGVYRVPNVDVEAHTVYTNNPPNGAFRGFGVNQTAFAIEGLLDRLADIVGIDGYDVRDRNILEKGDMFGPGQIMGEGLGIRETLESVRDDYKEAKFVGIACGIKNTGIGNGMADIGRTLLRVESPDSLVVYTGFTEMGQGLYTILFQVVCHETGLPSDVITVKVNTTYAVECGMTTASRATMLASESTMRAAVKLAADLQGGATLADLVGREYEGEFICDFTVKPTGAPGEITHVTFGYATQVVILNDEGTLERVIAAHDVGRIMNRALCEGQLEGAIHMGLGYGLTEDLPMEGGWPVSTKLNDLQILRPKHVPDIEVRLIEVPDPHTKYGAKGVGEIGLVPTAAAVAGALHAFDGIRRTRLPMRGSAAARSILPRKFHEEDHA
jgi:xanthine dehydrogenase molybdenum-binding subunit